MNDDYLPAKGDGWIIFAGIIIAIAGALNVIYGIAAIDQSATFVEGNRFVIFDDIQTWGWIHLVIGVAQLFASFSIWNGHTFGRLIGIITCAVSAVALLLFVNAFPWVAFGIFIIDMLVIYALAVYGGSRRQAGA